MCKNDTEIDELLKNLDFKIYSIFENGDFHGFKKNA